MEDVFGGDRTGIWTNIMGGRETLTRGGLEMDRMTGEATNSLVEVEIFGQAYKLRGKDPDYLRSLAEYVDEKMRRVAEKTSTADSSRWRCWRH